MLTQQQGDQLVATLKEAAPRDVFVWVESRRQDEMLVSVDHDDLRFILTRNRNPFEIRSDLPTKQDNIGLMRVDGAPYHANPDGTELRNTRHPHVYREGHDVSFAEPVDWECGFDTGQMAPNLVQQAAVLAPEGEEVAWPSW